MFPIRDHNPSLKTPYVTYALMLVNVVVFLTYWADLQNPQVINPFFYDWAMVPALVTNGDHYYSMVSSMFLHGGFMHLAGNMLFLWIFGDNMEEQLGHIGYLVFYFAVGLAAGFAQVLVDPTSSVPVVGASGCDCRCDGGLPSVVPQGKNRHPDHINCIFPYFPSARLDHVGPVVRPAIVQRYCNGYLRRRGGVLGTCRWIYRRIIAEHSDLAPAGRHRILEQKPRPAPTPRCAL